MALPELDLYTEMPRMRRMVSGGESRGESIPGRRELGSGPGALDQGPR